MANLGTLFINVSAKTGKAEKQAESLKKKFAGIGKAIKVGAAVATGALAGIGVASVKLAQEQEKAEARLESIATGVTKATKEEIQALKEQAAALQKVSTAGDEVVITGQSQLLSFGLTADQAGQLSGSLVDLLAANKGVSATTDDAIGAANLLGKAFSGQVGALSKVGILLDDAQAAVLKNGTAAEKTAILVEIMNQNYGGLAETLSKTSEGQLQQAKNALGDVGEVLGSFLLPAFNGFLKWILDNMPNIQNIFVGVFEFLGKTIETFSPIFQAVFEAVFPIIESLMPVVQEVFDEVKNIVNRAIQIAKDIIAEIFPFFKDIFDKLKPIVEFLLPIFKDVFEKIKETVGKAIETAKNIFETIKPFISDIIDALTPVIEVLVPIFKKVFDKVIEIVQKLLPIGEKIVETFGPVLVGVFEFLSPIIEKLAPVFETTFGIVTGAIEIAIGVIEWFVELIGKALDFFKRFNKERDKSPRSAINVETGTIEEPPPIGVQAAFGGRVKAGQAALVGERGREIFVPDVSGRVMTGMGMQNTFNISGTNPEATAQAVVRILKRQGVKINA